MFTSSIILAAAALFGSSNAQLLSNGLNYSTSGPLMIDVDQVSYDLRVSWCNGQSNACGALCTDGTANNTCYPNTLDFNCTCSGVTTQPNISNYVSTMPSYICGVWVANCVDGHPMDLVGITACRSTICGNETLPGSQNAAGGSSSGGSSSSSSTAGSTTTAATTGAGSSSTSGASTTSHAATSTSASAASTSPTKNAAVAALTVAKDFGTPVLGAAMLAVFGLAL